MYNANSIIKLVEAVSGKESTPINVKVTTLYANGDSYPSSSPREDLVRIFSGPFEDVKRILDSYYGTDTNPVKDATTPKRLISMLNKGQKDSIKRAKSLDKNHYPGSYGDDWLVFELSDTDRPTELEDRFHEQDHETKSVSVNYYNAPWYRK